MTLRIDDLEAMVTAAATLAECLAADRDADPSEVPGTVADDDRALVRAWQQAAAGSDAGRWTRRLEWDGLRESALVHAIARPGTSAELPEWAVLLEAVSRDAASSADQVGLLAPRSPRHAFDELLQPFVAVGAARVRDAAARIGERVTPDAHAMIEGGLMAQLSALAVRALYAEFRSARSAAGNGSLAVFQSALAGGTRRQYDAFLATHLTDGLRTLLTRYPVLSRLLATRTLDWVRNTVLILDRLNHDWDAVVAAFQVDGRDPGAVTGVDVNLSDPHRGGSTVSILRFGDGLRVVYKPRSLRVDGCFAALLASLNALHVGLRLQAPVIIEREHYGWVEFAVTGDCTSTAAVERYYERGGMLVALSYVLGASDLHSANVLACGEHPILIDLEVMCNPIVDTGIPIERSGRVHTHSTVLSSALLPSRTNAYGIDFVDGGLLDRTTQQTYSRETLRFFNTDMMSWGTYSFVGGGRENVPMLNGVATRTRDYLDALRQGFGTMYDLLRRHRRALLAEDGPIGAFATASVRIVHRPTGVYDQLLQRTLNAQFLRRGVVRSIEFERMNASTIAQTARPKIWPLLSAEQRELERGDIPVFLSQPGGRTLETGNGAVADDVLIEPGLDGVIDRLCALSDADRERQLDLVRLAFAGADDYVVRLVERDTASPEDTDAEALAEAVRIGETLLRLRRNSTDSSWLGLVGRDSKSTRLQPIDSGLFDGLAGVALFLGTLGACSGQSQFRDAAEGSVRPFRQMLAHDRGRRALVERLGIGGAYGVGGLVYTFVRLAQALDDASYLDDARAAAAAISSAEIARDTRRDVMFGSAGAILALLVLYYVDRDPAILAKATQCGAELMASQLRPPNPGAGHWLTGGDTPETGFAHGTAGIALALSRLSRVAPSAALDDCLARALASLDGAFDSVQGNWIDRVGGHVTGAPSPWSSWCRGAGGIGMAHLAMRGAGVGDHDTRIDAACANVMAHDFPAKDHMCCGTTGRIDFLISAGMRLGRPELIAAARAKSVHVRRERVRRGSYSTGFIAELSPGLFQGIAGIGYGMLRVARPKSVPSVLVWD